MAAYLVDSNITIDWLAGRSEVRQFFRECRQNGDSFFSAITVAETLSGTPIQRQTIFTSGIKVVTKSVAKEAARIRINQRTTYGRRVKTPDAIITATAHLYGLTLVTNDEQMIDVATSIGVSSIQL